MCVLRRVAVLLLSLPILAAAQTLRYVSTGNNLGVLNSTIITVSPLGVGSDGETTYVEVAVDGTQGSPSSPAILDIPTPLTLTTTFAEGASAMRESLLLPGEDFAFTCTFSDGRGTCFQSVGVSNPTRSGSVTPHVFTFSGPLAPLYTLPSRAPASLGPGTSASISTPSPTVPTPMPTAVNGAETKIPSCLVYGVLYFMVSILAYIL
ncbi:hypothetical protein C8F04DRAFT_1401845 [Mycena alexandri]|uniref:Uncharacterized protein n=1 Tax=Mycena alexandri TaxID=1745969 RepID=A0AAD6WS98_9AGAR|nr:hypothetical protein C8F04DRAFT_1401845 [Mycena alexandri]